jgi:hypothetical protein
MDDACCYFTCTLDTSGFFHCFNTQEEFLYPTGFEVNTFKQTLHDFPHSPLLSLYKQYITYRYYSLV